MSDDRHSKTGIGEHEKQTAHGWGGQSGTEELADEKAGEAIAKAEESQGVDELPSGANLEGQDWGAPAEGADAAAEAEAAAAEAEEKTKSYAAYLAEQAEKKLSLGLTTPEARKANEGSSSKFPEGKALHPRGGDDEEGDVYFSGQGGKAKRERARKEKTLVELDDARLRDQPREGGFRGGRGGRRGSEGGGYRGEGRGRGGRGRGEGGPPRGAGGPPRGAGGPPRGAGPRGGRGGQSGPNVSDTNAFPSLGA
ncbi:hypothetical protein BDY21DRAFT_349032 [Lineolata rhizophorae]|uniref:Hyaluronan/mRNA-binding protein domain-containing protein n=1 Tax=Lineolata rhizophorae TaxID=578093 RepID=A0A6A6NW00_9PEZI|nr:hypothetical protein BDY21DRAFT_349032 [Lineolata rhizophorae]